MVQAGMFKILLFVTTKQGRNTYLYILNNKFRGIHGSYGGLESIEFVAHLPKTKAKTELS